LPRTVRWRRRHPVCPWRTSRIRRRCCITAAHCRLRHGAANGGAQGRGGRENGARRRRWKERMVDETGERGDAAAYGARCIRDSWCLVGRLFCLCLGPTSYAKLKKIT
jgi:hypothetical protein